MSLFNELKRRNVFRVGVAYLVGAWLLIQVSDIVIDNIGAPPIVLQVIFLALGVGFFVSLFVAWAFEMTPEGIKKEKDVERSESITPVTGQKLNYTIIGLLVLALGYFIWESEKGLGYADKAISDMQHCLDIDPGYLNCKQHQAQAYLISGDKEQAMALFTQTIEANFHSQDGPFIPIAVNSGDHLLALYMANTWTKDRYAPVIDWIDALENPNSDHTARLHRFERWAKEKGEDISLFVGVLLAFKAYDYFAKSNSMPDSEIAEMWQPNWSEFRQTTFFKQFVRKNNFLAYWCEAGFPKQCRPVGEDDFECD